MLGQSDDAGFGSRVDRRRVDGAAEIFGAFVDAMVGRHQAVDRGGLHDGAVAALSHSTAEGLGDVEHAVEIDRHDLPPGL